MAPNAGSQAELGASQASKPHARECDPRARLDDASDLVRAICCSGMHPAWRKAQRDQDVSSHYENDPPCCGAFGPEVGCSRGVIQIDRGGRDGSQERQE